MGNWEITWGPLANIIADDPLSCARMEPTQKIWQGDSSEPSQNPSTDKPKPQSCANMDG